MAASLAEARSHNVAPDIFIRFYREIRDCRAAHADTGAAVTRAMRKAKSAGIDLDAVRLLERLADLDPDAAEMQLRNLRNYAAWLDLPIGAQLSMFDEPSPDDDTAPRRMLERRRRGRQPETATQAAVAAEAD